MNRIKESYKSVFTEVAATVTFKISTIKSYTYINKMGEHTTPESALSIVRGIEYALRKESEVFEVIIENIKSDPDADGSTILAFESLGINITRKFLKSLDTPKRYKII